MCVCVDSSFDFDYVLQYDIKWKRNANVSFQILYLSAHDLLAAMHNM